MSSTFVKPDAENKPQDAQQGPELAGPQVSQFQAPEGGKRKRFFSPSEIRKRKGCIGCGGAGVIAIISAVLAVVIAVL